MKYLTIYKLITCLFQTHKNGAKVIHFRQLSLLSYLHKTSVTLPLWSACAKPGSEQ